MGNKFLIPAIALLFLLALSLKAYAGLVYVRKIKVTGAKKFSNSRIKKLILTDESKWYSGIFKDKPYLKESLLKADLERIANFYRSQGFPYINVKAELEQVGKNEVTIIIAISEGKRYNLDSVSILGNHILSSDIIAKELKLKFGAPFNFNILPELERRVKFLYACRGHPYAKVHGAYSLNDSTQGVSLTLTVEEGKKAYFGSSILHGLEISRPSIINRELAFQKGEIYAENKLIISRLNLLGTQLFELVDIRPDSLELERDSVPIKVTVVERSPNYVGANLTFSTNPNYDITMDITGELGNRNLFGTGRAINIKGISQFELFTKFRNLKNRFIVGYYEPFALGLKLPLRAELYFDPGNRSESEQYRIQRFGGTISSVYQIDTLKYHRIAFSYERVDIYGITDSRLAENIKLSQGIRIKRALVYLFSRDRRDNLFLPTGGSNFRAQIEYAGFGGDDNYLLLRAEWARYISMSKNLIYANRIAVAGIGNLKRGEDVLPHNRLFLGGGGSIRGFAEKGLGPKDSTGAPIGGKALFLMNYELRIHLFWKAWATGFIDIGNLWGKFESVTPSQLRLTGGWGLALITPVGPLRFDYAYHIRKLDPGVKPRWHLGIFYAF